MSDFLREARLLLSLRAAVAALLALFALSAVAVGTGLLEVRRQQEVIARIQPQQAEDVAAIAHWVDRDKDAGNAAYYTFHATWDAPSDLAFAALGMRDVAPYVLRVRALGLEAQLYEGETGNPELALPGRFDYAFVLVYLAPLFVILLFHDLFSGEREAGRFAALEVAASGGRRLWAPRAGARFVGLSAVVLTPFLAGAVVAGATPWKIAAVAALSLAYIGFWCALSMAVAGAARASLANAMSLAACWLVLTLLAPAAAHVAINAAVPLRQGMELSQIQRTAVHKAWDIPKSETMNAFFRTHPEWATTEPVTTPFHWKWYFAFHQVGDDRVKALARAYRDGVLERASLSERLGLLIPSVGVQTALHRLADTDQHAQMRYLDSIRAYHGELRRFYYPYLFDERPFGRADFALAPAFRPAGEQGSLLGGAFVSLFALTVVLLGWRVVRRSYGRRPLVAMRA